MQYILQVNSAYILFVIVKAITKTVFGSQASKKLDSMMLLIFFWLTR